MKPALVLDVACIRTGGPGTLLSMHCVTRDWPAENRATPPQHQVHETGAGLSVVVASVASDSHTWNLVYLQLILTELGHRVRNLGACVPDELLIAECLRQRPGLVVISTVNGHGFLDGTRLISRVREHPELADVPVVIGGKLGVAGPGGRHSRERLLAAGFDAVFEEDGVGVAALRSFTARLTEGVDR